MAAGARQSDDSRARILSAVPGAMDTSETINSFAANRLEMAKLKIAEQAQAREAASAGMFDQMINAALPGGGAPAATASAVPGIATAPGAANAPGALAPVQAEGGTVAADGTVQLPAVTVSASTLGTEAPPPPASKYTLTPEDAMALRVIPDVKGKTDYFLKRQNEFNDTQVKTDPYLNPDVGVMVDVYKGGRKIGTEKVGDLTTSVEVTVDPETGEKIYQEIAADGTLKKETRERDPVRDKEREAAFSTDSKGRRNVIENGVVVRQEAVPGSAAEAEQIANEKAEGVASETRQRELRTTVTAIDQAFTMVEDNKDSWTPAVGGSTAVTKNLPFHPARDLAQTLETVKANISFDKLREMKAASPTGASGLGSLTEKEAERLAAIYGSLEQSVSPPQFEYNLAKLRNELLDVVHGVGEGGPRIDLSKLPGAPREPNLPGLVPTGDGQSTAPTADPELDDLLKKYGGQ